MYSLLLLIFSIDSYNPAEDHNLLALSLYYSQNGMRGIKDFNVWIYI